MPSINLAVQINKNAGSENVTPISINIPGQNLFWKIAVDKYSVDLAPNEALQLANLGNVLYKYQKSLCDIYENDITYRDYCDTYRSNSFLKNYTLSKKLNTFNILFRPDIVLSSDDSFKIAEIDALPGELGIDTFLAKTYNPAYVDATINSIRNILSEFNIQNKIDFIIDKIDSEEEYILEYQYLGKLLKEYGVDFSIYSINEYNGPSENHTFVYRFFDMVHNDQSTIKKILNNVHKTSSYIYPALNHFIEEKLSLAVIHCIEYEKYLLCHMTRDELNILKKHIPKTYLINKKTKTIFPNPIELNNTLLATLGDIINYSKNNKFNFILKTSGFSDCHSTSKGIIDLSNKNTKDISTKFNWTDKFEEHFILQEKIDSKTISVSYFDFSKKQIFSATGRTRLTPYYFFYNNRFHLSSAHIVIRDKPDVHFANDAIVTTALIRESI